MSEHVLWEELAAGYALHSLEPGEEATFAAHLQGCLHCTEALAGHALVAAQLGTLAGEARVPSWDRIRAGVLLERPSAPVVVPLRHRRTRVLLAAAAGLLLVVGGLVVTTNGHGTPAAEQAVRSCAHMSGCRVVRLAAAGQEQAAVLVTDGVARLAATRLPAATVGYVYVLWQLPRDGRPAVVSDLPGARRGQVSDEHALVLPYVDTAAFGLSLEPIGAVPTHPTRVVGVGPA